MYTYRVCGEIELLHEELLSTVQIDSTDEDLKECALVFDVIEHKPTVHTDTNQRKQRL